MNTDYLKFVRWNQSDRMFVGYCPDLFIGGVCHGLNEQEVYSTLCELVESELHDRRKSRRKPPLPQAMVTMPVPV